MTRWKAASATLGGMAFNHVVFATHDLQATHEFYTESMGFELAKVVVGPTDHGWAKHVFYRTGDAEMIAFWDLHDDTLPADFPTDLSKSRGLPEWVNHLAFDAATTEDLATARQRWQDQGITVVEVDHGFCVSIYATDPNGILVEFCHNTRALDAADAAEALALLNDPAPPLGPEPTITIHHATTVDATP